MPSLSDKLKSLGVKVGLQEYPRPPHSISSLEEVLGGRAYETQHGETFLVEAHYPSNHLHGRVNLGLTAPMHGLSFWMRDERIQNLAPTSIAFLDTETTGLSGGTGTYAFLIGAGRFDHDGFQLTQFFMRDPAEEPAQLLALENFLAPCQAIVTYNGKTFDIPLLNTRFSSHGWISPFSELTHFDLLHLARKLWRDRLPSRSLSNIEVQILGTERTQDDVPGWMIPQMYFDFLRSNDPIPLKKVFYHNAMDVVSLAALLEYTAWILADPLNYPIEHGIDLIAQAKLFEELENIDVAASLYVHGLEHPDATEQHIPETIYLQALERLALIHKRQGNFETAVELWQRAALHSHIPACIELAKYFEHHKRNYKEALYWTSHAIHICEQPPSLRYPKNMLLPELDHRLKRIKRKIDISD